MTGDDDADTTGITQSSIPVHSGGRITVGSTTRDLLGLVVEDPIQATIHDEDDDFVFVRKLDMKNRLTIPKNIRDDAGIGDGDRVTVTVREVDL